MPSTTIIVATGNLHKVAEISEFLGSGVRVLGLKNFPSAPVAIEDAATFEGNAEKKCRTLALWLHAQLHPVICAPGPVVVLADDSGLEVDALQGAPGVYSARFAHLDAAGGTGNAADADNNAKLLRLMHSVDDADRGAQFRCVLAALPVRGGTPVGRPVFFEGFCRGRILRGPGGEGGFGYDPLFVPADRSVSFAELGAAVKNRISHRAHALMKLRDWMAGSGG